MLGLLASTREVLMYDTSRYSREIIIAQTAEIYCKSRRAVAVAISTGSIWHALLTRTHVIAYSMPPRDSGVSNTSPPNFVPTVRSSTSNFSLIRTTCRASVAKTRKKLTSEQQQLTAKSADHTENNPAGKTHILNGIILTAVFESSGVRLRSFAVNSQTKR